MPANDLSSDRWRRRQSPADPLIPPMAADRLRIQLIDAAGRLPDFDLPAEFGFLDCSRVQNAMATPACRVTSRVVLSGSIITKPPPIGTGDDAP